MKWTKEQENAIYKKGSNILVAAAAGSGKTAVLVERIIQKIINEGVDIDKLLVVTFTNAAASEMRERVLEAIYKKQDEDPENENLQRQIILLGKANICTIHSFCLDVIKNNFFEIDLSANFRIGSEEEIELLREEVLEDVLDKLYESEDEDFERLVNTYTGYRGDESLKEIILSIYKFMQSSPFPNQWLSEKIDMFKRKKENNYDDFSKSVWGEILIKNLKEEIEDGANSLKIIRNKLELVYELEKYKQTIESDIELLRELYGKLNSSWDEAYEFSQNMKFKTWPSDRKISMDLKDEAKKSRDIVKNKIMKLIKDILVYNSEDAYSDIYEMYDTLNNLKNVIFLFDTEFKKRKKEKNIIDFGDIEHYALNILVKKDSDGNYVATDVAKKYQEQFEEIAIDEYQDSNQVQEYILNMVSKGNNLFMVGDVKQSIYKFRQACPELFLEKYDKYTLVQDEASKEIKDGMKIQLFKNFRSRKNVLDITNLVFENIMSKTLGDIDYNEDEYLNLGADYEESKNTLGHAELDIIDLKEIKDEDIWKESNNDNQTNEALNQEKQEDDDDEDENSHEMLEKEEIEAKFVMQKIKDIVNDSKYQVYDKKKNEYRSVTYKDIVILLRSTSKVAPIYEKELLKNDIPVFSDSSNEYLDTIEIQTIINLLKILDNPIDDISIVSVLRSQIGKFTDNEILQIRLCEKEDSFYNSLLIASENLNGEIKEKIDNFLNNVSKWRTQTEYLSLAEVIWGIYVDTGFYNYVGLMPNGSLRQANLKMLFERAKEYEMTSFKGIFNFISFIEKLKNGNTDMSAAKVIGENENVVRIMSIHKSKGLEFPIVFLSNTSKKINMQDLNQNLLLHQKLGIGPQYINYEKMIEYSTSAKDAIKIAIKEENISEEMRILYVALTRAKEKLIITGVSKDYLEDIEKKKEILKVYNSKNKKINPILLKKYISYLDWLELVILNNDNKTISDVIEMNVYKKEDVLKKQEEKEVTLRDFDFDKKINIEKYDDLFNWKYRDEFLTKLPVKSTVSKIKEMKTDENGVEFESLTKKQVGIESLTPNFLSLDENNISGARKGTLMHLFLQNINLRKEYSIEELKDLKEQLVEKNIISEEESKLINEKDVICFLNSNFANKIRKSIKIEKEKAFCIKMNAKEIYEDAKEEDFILVQGIIDLYAIDENNNIILVDYKTDFVNNENELVKRYEVQLKLYKKAIEDAFSLPVKETYIYSLHLNKEIKLDL